MQVPSLLPVLPSMIHSQKSWRPRDSVIDQLPHPTRGPSFADNTSSSSSNRALTPSAFSQSGSSIDEDRLSRKRKSIADKNEKERDGRDGFKAYVQTMESWLLVDCDVAPESIGKKQSDSNGYKSGLIHCKPDVFKTHLAVHARLLQDRHKEYVDNDDEQGWKAYVQSIVDDCNRPSTRDRSSKRNFDPKDWTFLRGADMSCSSRSNGDKCDRHPGTALRRCRLNNQREARDRNIAHYRRQQSIRDRALTNTVVRDCASSHRL